MVNKSTANSVQLTIFVAQSGWITEVSNGAIPTSETSVDGVVGAGYRGSARAGGARCGDRFVANGAAELDRTVAGGELGSWARGGKKRNWRNKILGFYFV